MSEQNAVQSVDIMMEIFNLVVSKWVYYYRELGEISMVQSSVDAIDTHLDVLKHQEYPLENAVSKSFEALVYGETMNFEYTARLSSHCYARLDDVAGIKCSALLSHR